MNGVPHYEQWKQDAIIKAAFGLHNFMRDLKPGQPMYAHSPSAQRWLASTAKANMEALRMRITEGLLELGYR